MTNKNLSRKSLFSTLKNKDETKNHFLEEIEQNKSMIRKHKKVCTTLNYVEHFFILASRTTRFISICFCFFLGIPIGFIDSAITLKIAGIKKYKSIIKKKKKRHDQKVLINKIA